MIMWIKQLFSKNKRISILEMKIQYLLTELETARKCAAEYKKARDDVFKQVTDLLQEKKAKQ